MLSILWLMFSYKLNMLDFEDFFFFFYIYLCSFNHLLFKAFSDKSDNLRTQVMFALTFQIYS